MDDETHATILPLLLVLLVVVAVGFALYFTVMPTGNGEGVGPGEPPAPEPLPLPEPPPEVANVPPPPAPIGGIVNGRVVDARGDPVEGAIVTLFPPRAPRPEIHLSEEEEKQRAQVAELYQYFPDEAKALHPLERPVAAPPGDDAPIAETKSRPDGEFRFKKPVRGPHRITAHKGPLASGERIVREGRPVTLTLRESATLSGVVRLRADSRPIGDAVVTVSLAGRHEPVRTAANGTFEVRGLPAGYARVEVTHPLYAGEILPRVRLEPGREKELLVELTKGYTLTVVVKDLDDDEEPPVPGARVVALRIADDGYVSGVADEKGRVVFPAIPPGDYFVNGIAKGYLASGEEKVKVRADTSYELFLEQAVISTLVVVDENGVPLPGAEVWTSDPDEEFHQGISRVVGRTDREGRFPFAFDFDGMRAVVYVVKKGYAVGVVTPDDPYEPENIRVVLPPARTLRGRVTDRSGKPIAGAKVYIEVLLDDANQEDLAATLYTDAEGRYEYPYLPPGEVWIEVEREGYESDEDDFETSAGRTEHVKNFVLERE